MEAPLQQSHPPPHGAAADVAGLQHAQQQQRRVAVGREQCPRCASRDTKFCYYNNYNTAQPRHFCRACRRYWTLGGSLRNVPIGGSTRKRPRPSRPTRAVVVAAAAAAGAVTTTTTTTSSCGPFASSPVAAPAQSALLGSLLGSAPLLALGAAPLLDGRLGFDLGLGQPGAGELGPLYFGAAPLLWPARILEGDNADTWKGAGVSPASVWQELAAAAPVEAGGLPHGAPQLL